MKKSLIALAVMAASGASMAQVTLFGTVDACVQYGTGDTNNKLALGHSCGNSSRLGFKGEEAIGSMKASFHLEATVANDSGAGGASSTDNRAATANGGGLIFNRRSTVSLAGNFGEVRLGRDYTPTFWSHTVYDPQRCGALFVLRCFHFSS